MPCKLKGCSDGGQEGVMEGKRGHFKAGPEGVELFSQLAQCTAHGIQQFDHATHNQKHTARNRSSCIK